MIFSRLSKIYRVFIFLSLLAFFLIAQSAFAAFLSPGNPTGYVNDFASILNEQTKASLEANLTQFDLDTSTQISIATVKDLGSDSIESYANQLFRTWSIGTKNNNGVLLLVAPNEHKVRIEVGYGLEGALPDVTANRIINDVILPEFKKDDYSSGVMLGVDAIEKSVRGEVFETKTSNNFSSFFSSHFGFIALFGIIAFQWLIAILGRSKSWWLGGVLGGVAGGIISTVFGLISIGIISLVVLIPLGLILDFIVSKSYSNAKNGGRTPPWFTGGGWGGGSSGGGGGSFGGFGGGSSGGGGASGSW